MNRLRVMTWNVRNGEANDGPDDWSRRKDHFIEVVRAIDPDVAMFQEAFTFQVEDLRAGLSGWADYGCGRDDGADAGERCQVFVRRSIEVVASGSFWLSETPDVPGSISWDTACTRQATWVETRDGATFANTHWDHRSEWARRESGRLLADWAIHRGPMVVLGGDFNAEADWSELRPLAETLARVTPLEPGTYHAFTGQAEGQAIDHVFAGSGWRADRAWIDQSRHGERYPSDHFAAIVDLVAR